MKMRKLGSSNIKVSPICFGCNVFGWTIDQTRSFEMLDGFVDAGFNFIDTADMYSRWVPANKGGESETIIGNWLANGGARDKVVLATKVGMEMGPDRKGLKAQYIMRAVEDSLRRLQTDYIDLYQSHQDDPDTPQEETLQAYAKLIEQGKVRIIGASNFSAQRLGSALELAASGTLPAYQCLQPLYNLVEREAFEGELQGLCERNNVSVNPYYSLASGFLSGKYRSSDDAGLSARGAGIVGKYLNPKGLAVLQTMDTISAQLSTSHTALAIAWLMAQPTITSPIVSATSKQQLAQIIAAGELTLPAQALGALDEASTGGASQ